LLESGSFDVCKNAVTPMITMLGHLEVNMEVSGAGIEITESDGYKGVSRDDKDANGMLAPI